jgi:hypothetical protein
MVLSYRTHIFAAAYQQGCFTASHGRKWIEGDSPLTYLVSPFIHRLLANLMNGVPLEKGLPKLTKPSGPPPVWSSSRADRKTLPLSKGTLKTNKTLKTPGFVGFAGFEGSLEHALRSRKNSPPLKKHCQNRRNRQYPLVAVFGHL